MPSQLILPIAAVLTGLDLATRNLPSIWLMLPHVTLEIGAMGEHTMHTERGLSGRTTLLAVFELTGGAIPVIVGVRLGVHMLSLAAATA